jgi:Zincin-like metallopeptidase
MNFADFERRAQEMFDTIPESFRGGVEYVAVSDEAVPHLDLPEVYTLGECATGELDLGYEVGDVVRSGVHLYHGSFRALARQDPDFDWEGELWETLTHEIRHHRESTAGEDALEDFDYAADENFKRREGMPFDPLFYRSGEPVDEGGWDVDGDLFVEQTVAAAEFERMEEVEAEVDGRRVSLPRPERLGDVSFMYLEGFRDGPGDTALVLVRRRGTWESLRGLFRRDDPEVLEWSVEPGDWLAEDAPQG